MAETTAGPAAPHSLKRVIGRRTLLLFVVGDILGAGIYALVGKVAGHAGGALWLPFLVAFVLAALTATAYAELVGKYPKAAGAALYANRAFGIPFVTFLVAFAVMMSGVTSASAAARAFGGSYLGEFVTLPAVVGAFGFLALVTLVNLAGISESVKVNVVLTVIEAFGLLVIVAIGVYALLTGEGEPARALEFHPEHGAFMGVLGGTALAFYALLGFEDSVNLAEEAKDPARDFPRALFGGLAAATVIYMAVVFTATMLVETETLVASTGPLLEVVRVAGLAFPPKLFALIALLAVGNTALINMIMASRLVYGMAREGIVPGAFAVVHPRRATPWVAILFTVAVAAVLVATGDVAGLADTTVLLLLCVFTMVNVAVLVLRRDPVAHDHFRAPSWMPALGAVVCLVLALPVTGRGADVYARAGLLLGVGALLWLVNRLFMGGGGGLRPGAGRRSSS
ncbi:amino acid permease [Planomonospora parontospora subsp. parontospora]|uniref:Amino acid permease n=2 Tax=Planomonospora parontospora TaxID=58119 RepID=A0AA37F2W4_9ACTN|nr:APC family permease [Planomonospora parontospora]GGK53030.1 amino acid permease [Planomonospora parontospora]GII06790.1 amino acid permease [Planomonospora parontospora subsp. parontospora]